MAEDRLEVDPDITRAWTIPSRVYFDPAVYESARGRIFARSWQIVADADAVRVPGKVFPATMLEGCLDEPILLTRDMDDAVHCLSNVCTHRGNLVCESPGMERFLRCRYHGRRFGLDGAFQQMPEFDKACDFPSPRDNLPRIASASIGPLIFASLAPAATFEALTAPMLERLKWFPFDRCEFEPARSRDYLVRANWALYCENYLEGFHIPFVHASLNETIDYANYRTELWPWGVLQLGVAKSGEPAFTLPSSSPDAGLRIGAYYYWLFPNTMLNVYPWGVSVNIVRPLGHGAAKVSFLSYVLDASKIGEGAGAGLDRVEREDESIVEAVQRGVRSRLYDRGRYSPTREQGVHHFHRLLCNALA